MRKIAIIAGVFLVFFAVVVGLTVYQHSLPPAEFKAYKGIVGVSSNDVLRVRMQGMAEQAAMDAWTRYRFRLHIRVDSLPDFERYLDLVYKSPQFQNFSPKDKQAEAIVDGAFVGEAIRRTHGGFWIEKSDIPGAGLFLLNTDGRINYPINWCLKRLVNGPEDNIYDKYVLLVLHRTNEFHGEITSLTNTEFGLKEIANIGVK
jgi:hypothetical protein